MKNVFKKIVERIYLSFNDNLVYYDSVTRCKSRFYYDAIIRIKYENVECRIVYVDINDLKQVNDNLGHCMGTQYIKCIADQLLELPRVRHVCRIGGDEFALICTTDFDEKDFAYADFEQYKEEVLNAESDELPDDDFRYGMERCLEILDKLIAESEGKE